MGVFCGEAAVVYLVGRGIAGGGGGGGVVVVVLVLTRRARRPCLSTQHSDFTGAGVGQCQDSHATVEP
jgi:hypothetical protein